jgi:hypothetical protein
MADAYRICSQLLGRRRLGPCRDKSAGKDIFWPNGVLACMFASGRFVLGRLRTLNSSIQAGLPISTCDKTFEHSSPSTSKKASP